MVVSLESFANLGQEELTSLRAAHGKLQKVLSEKASELSHAVRRAELFEREARKLRHKLEDIRRQQRYWFALNSAARETEPRCTGTTGKSGPAVSARPGAALVRSASRDKQAGKEFS